MRVNYQYNNKIWSYFHYNQFSVGNASEEYPHTIGDFTGAFTDVFANLNGKKFSTLDNHNSVVNCAIRNKSVRWYQNGANFNPLTCPMLLSEMKIRTKDCIT